jgi:hypothetical protein
VVSFYFTDPKKSIAKADVRALVKAK